MEETFIFNLFGNTGSRNALKLIGLEANNSSDDVKWNRHVTNLTNGTYVMNPANIYKKIQVPSW